MAVNVNYRLLPDNPFPAPLEDVIAAFEWIGRTDQQDLARQDRGRIALLGASAGSYLAAALGLMMGRQRVRSIVAISGPSTRRRTEQVPGGADPRLFFPPSELASADAPPLLATHSRNDRVVAHAESVALVGALRGAGAEAELYSYDGPGQQHGIWREQTKPLRFLEHLEHAIAGFLRRTL